MSDDGSPPADEPTDRSFGDAPDPASPSEEGGERRHEDAFDDTNRFEAIDGTVPGHPPESDRGDDGDTGIDRDDRGVGPEGRRHGPHGSDSQESGLSRVLSGNGELLLYAREVLTSVLAVVVVGLLLFAISGVWPPMVAVESGSMEPHMHRGDLVFITEPHRFSPETAVGDTGVVTTDVAEETGYRSFGDLGAVIVYDNPGIGGSPIIHRARFWVGEGENWYDRANPEHVRADSCDALRNCPAPHAGFVTKGDHNDRYDQANGISEPVKPAWVSGIARVRIPYLGLIRLSLGSLADPGLATVNPGLATVNPGPTTVNPGPTTGTPGLATVNPGLATVNPGPTTVDPGLATENAGLATAATPGPEPGATGAACPLEATATASSSAG